MIVALGCSAPMIAGVWLAGWGADRRRHFKQTGTRIDILVPSLLLTSILYVFRKSAHISPIRRKCRDRDSLLAFADVDYCLLSGHSAVTSHVESGVHRELWTGGRPYRNLPPVFRQSTAVGRSVDWSL